MNQALLDAARRARLQRRRDPINPALFAEAARQGLAPKYSVPNGARLEHFREAHRYGDTRAIIKIAHDMLETGDAYSLVEAIALLESRTFRGARRVG